jgi:hypothetical protein
MMVQFEVGGGGHDPIKADPCKDQGKMGPLFVVPEEDDHGGRGSTPGGDSDTIVVPAAPAPAPKVNVLGTKVKKTKAKPKRKVKVKRKLKAKPKHKTQVKRKPAAKKKSPRRKPASSSRGRS